MSSLLTILQTPLTAPTVITPPTRVLGVTPAVGFGDTSTTKTSPTFDVTTGDLIVLQAFSEDSARTISTPTWDGTGAWTLRQSIVVAGYCTAYLYTCAVTATATGRTISATCSAAAMWSFRASLWRNHGGLGVTGKSNVTNAAPTLTLPLSPGSAVVCGNSDWAAIDGTTRAWRPVNGAAMSETAYFRSAANYTLYAGNVLDVGSVGSPETMGLSAPAGQTYSIMAAEILGTVASGPTSYPVTSATAATASGASTPTAVLQATSGSAATSTTTTAPTARLQATSATAATASGSSDPTIVAGSTVYPVTSATVATADGASSPTLRAVTTSATSATSVTATAPTLKAGASSATTATAGGSSSPTARLVTTSATAATADGSSAPTVIGGSTVYPVTSATVATSSSSSAPTLRAGVTSATVATSSTASAPTARYVSTSATFATSTTASTVTQRMAITSATSATADGSSDPWNLNALVDITVTGSIDARRWTATLTGRAKTATLDPRTRTGTLDARRWTGIPDPRRWEGTT